MKKLMNDPRQIVAQMLSGMSHALPFLSFDRQHNVIYRRDMEEKVGLVSGGGAGHEPAHAGYVGRGMLDAAVAGNVFASPGPDAILEGIRKADAGKGVLLIIKNYSGDVMNFQMAAELAQMEGREVESVVVKDDVAVPDSTYSTGRRGIAGTVLVHKIAGAKAESGASLDQVKAVAEKCISGVRTMGMAMTPCILPGMQEVGFTLGKDEMEIGMGIHGEPGVHRQKIVPAADVAQILLDKILADLDYAGSEVAVLVNGLGGTPLMELYVMWDEVYRILGDRDIRIHRGWVGNYMTSLEMAGCSITLLKLDEELKLLLDRPSMTAAFPVA